MKAIDLFCGCGGLTLGVKRAGFQVVGAVDTDGLAVKTYKANHPEVQVWEEDIRPLSTRRVKHRLRIRKGELDLLAGCPPCQGFSTMRTLNGAVEPKDDRNDLIFVFMKWVSDFMPRAVMLENVPGLVQDVRFKRFCRILKNHGYIGRFDILNAAEYGVPQRRRRLIYVAGLGREIPFADKAIKQKTVRETIGALPPAGNSGDSAHDLPEKRNQRVVEIIRMIPRDGGSRKDLGEARQLECHKRCDGFKDVYGRMAWDEVAPTITGGCFNPSKGRFLHPEEDRAITMREAAMLQSFPRRYKFPVEGNKCALALMIGNALPPEFGAALGRSIKRALSSRSVPTTLPGNNSTR